MKAKKIFCSYILPFVVILSFIGCKTPELVKVKELRFETNNGIWNNFIGVYFNQEDSTEYMYFADDWEFGSLMFFDMDGNVKKEVSLKEVLDWRTLKNAVVKNFDTIITLHSTGYHIANDKIAFMDTSGHCWDSVELRRVIETKNGDIYHIQTPFAGDIISDDVLFLGVEWSRRLGEPRPEEYQEFKKYYFPNVFKSPSMLLFNVKTRENQLILPEMWRTICPDTNLFFFYLKNIVQNNILFMYANSDNILYLIDTKSLKLKKTLPIVSKHTSIGMAHHTLDGRDSGYACLYGNIVNILYDKHNDLYYIPIRHKLPEEERIFYSIAPFSILIYDSNFKKIAEQCFDGKYYTPNDCKISKDGLLIRHNENNRNYVPLITKYDLYVLQK